MEPDANKDKFQSIVNDPAALYENEPTDQLKAALQRTHLERLLFATRLYKIQQTLSRAVVTHKADMAPDLQEPT